MLWKPREGAPRARLERGGPLRSSCEDRIIGATTFFEGRSLWGKMGLELELERLSRTADHAANTL